MNGGFSRNEIFAKNHCCIVSTSIGDLMVIMGNALNVTASTAEMTHGGRSLAVQTLAE